MFERAKAKAKQVKAKQAEESADAPTESLTGQPTKEEPRLRRPELSYFERKSSALLRQSGEKKNDQNCN
jgi:hypothetical protein